MTQAAAAAIAWYFSQTDADLLSKHFPDNTGSRAVLLKVGFANTMLGHVLQASTEKRYLCNTWRCPRLRGGQRHTIK